MDSPTRAPMSTQETAATPESLRSQASSVPGFDESLEVNAGTIAFADLCKALERVSKLGKKEQKLQVLFNRNLAVHIGYQSPWPLLRLLLPHWDHHRGKYFMKESRLETLISAVKRWPRRGEKATMLRKYTNPPPLKNNAGGDYVAGDFASVVRYLLRQYCPSRPDPTVTLQWINDMLDKLAAQTTDAGRKPVLFSFLAVLTADEVYWLVRILMGSMKFGLNENSILNHYHPEMRSLLDQNTDLRAVCTQICTQGDQLMAANRNVVTLHQCFRPMLAARLRNQFQAATDRLRGKPFVLDIKLDGDRIVAHKRGRHTRLFTRRATDYTPTYQRMLRYFQPPFLNVEDCIVDGEMCSWDTDSGKMVPFGENRMVAGEDASQSGRHLFYVAFDLLYIDDSDPKKLQGLVERVLRSLLQQPFPSVQEDPANVHGSITHLPLFFRRALLMEILRPEAHRFEVVKHEVVTEASAAERKRRLETSFRDAMNRKEEGLVVKNLLSPYLLGESSKKAHHWMKLKPEYSASEHIDCIVLGAWFHEGLHRSGQLTRFLCFVRGSRQADDPESGVFYSFARVASLKTREILEIEELCGDKWQDFDPDHPPAEWAPWAIRKADNRPDKVLSLEDGFVAQISFAEIVQSADFAANKTGRFPRCDFLRHDLGPEHTASLADLEMGVDDREKRRGTGPSVRQSRRGPKAKRKRRGEGVQVDAPHLVERLATAEGMKPVDEQIFAGMTFCVLGGAFTKSDLAEIPDEGRPELDGQKRLQRLLQIYGGDVVANPLESVDVEDASIIIVRKGTKGTRSTRILKKSCKYNMLYHTWVLRAIREGREPPVDFDECYAAVGMLKEQFDLTYDAFGNHASTFSTIRTLRACLARETTVPAPATDFPSEAVMALEDHYGVTLNATDPDEVDEDAELLPAQDNVLVEALVDNDNDVTPDDVAKALDLHAGSRRMRAALEAVQRMEEAGPGLPEALKAW